ncbi:uncharacterized protein [Triticum aestivum]|uniref:uncharacterized protein n=1 Tax=Triticum aestivum TaxID=4565 RepID=UPI000989E23D|nr:uncharacterized protein LOC109776879 [Aegilops tauschii subsp. strangulata]XP_044356550.1 uncharacterized protein LOC123078200 [Triticum aestivum]
MGRSPAAPTPTPRSPEASITTPGSPAVPTPTPKASDASIPAPKVPDASSAADLEEHKGTSELLRAIKIEKANVAIPMDPGGGKNKGSGGGKEVLCSPCHTVYLMSRWVFLFLLLPSSVFKFERNAA